MFNVIQIIATLLIGVLIGTFLVKIWKDTRKISDSEEERTYTEEEVEKINRRHRIEIQDTERLSIFNIERLNQNSLIQINNLKADQAIVLQQKEFELKHYKDEKIKALENTLVVINQTNAVLEQKVEMLEDLVDINSDVVDVKALVKSLIDKLPVVDLKHLNINVESKGKETK